MESVKRNLFIIWLLFACTGTEALARGLFSLSAATDFTTGNYGGVSPTDIWYVPFTARYDKGRASFRVIVPYIDITGPGNVLGPGIGGIDGRGVVVGNGFLGASSVVVCDEDSEGCMEQKAGRSNGGNPEGGKDSESEGIGGGNDDENSEGDGDEGDGIKKIKLKKIEQLGLVGGIPIGGSSRFRTSQSGLGDVVTAFSYNLIDHAPTGIAFDITARLKIPTASTSQNLGSGQVDYAIQGDLFKTMSQFTLAATFGYRILGNPSVIPFHNVFYGAASIGYRLSSTVSLGTSYTMAQSPVRLQDSRDLTLYLSQRVSDNFRLNVYGLRGFSERSPDWGGGINLRYIF